MSFTDWLSRRLRLSAGRLGPTSRPARKWRTRAATDLKPYLEHLEDRLVPSTLFVTDGSNDNAAVAGTLRWAVANANNGDTIIVKGPALATGITLQSQVVLSQQGLTIETNGQGQATITQTGADRIFSVSPGAQVTLSDLTLTGGNSGGPGGGIYNDGTLALNSCNLSGDSTSNPYLIFGGGIFNASDGTLTLTGCILSHDTGSGLWNNGTTTIDHSRVSRNTSTGITNSGTLMVSNSIVSDNGTAGYGFELGGISNRGMATITNSKVSDNHGSFGAGIGNWVGGILTVTGCTLSGNHVENTGGGGIGNAGTATVTDSKLSNNHDDGFDGQGGAVCNSSTGTLTMSGCTLTDNSATAGGAIFNTGMAKLSDCTLSNNNGPNDTYGGAIYHAGGAMTISGCTLTGNFAQLGGGIYNAGAMTASGCTLTCNSAGWGGGIFAASGTLTLSVCTLTNNVASDAGGGLYVYGYATVTVENGSSITGNTAPTGYGPDVYSLGLLYLDSTSTIGVLDGNPAKRI